MPLECASMPHRGSWVELNPAFSARFAALGLNSADRFLDLPGEIVSGHPDRHVLRVRLPGIASGFFLKRQHVVSRRERFRNWRAGFGWVSRSAREAEVLKRLVATGLPCPRWAALGEDGRGRAFLLVEELGESIDLRQCLSLSDLSARDRTGLADRLGCLLARLHSDGFTTPDFTAKHIFVNRRSGDIIPIDWQSSRLVQRVSQRERIRALAALHASLADDLAAPRERLRVFRTALSRYSRAEVRSLVRIVLKESEKLRERRSARDQRAAGCMQQRLVWLAGEAVCAVPAVADTWPTPAVYEPFYGREPGDESIRLGDGRAAHLIRGRSHAPLGRLRAWLRARPWRSPGVMLGRVLFHLERYCVPAPRLLAFGQRLTGPMTAEWFALHTPPAPSFTEITRPVAEQLGRLLRRLHDAGCRPNGDPLITFGIDNVATVRDVTNIRLVRRLSRRERATDLQSLMNLVEKRIRIALENGYAMVPGKVKPSPHRRVAVSPCR
jgi:tRNA A-37 threonylcarbamoyl transferase component Bud32